MFTDQMTKARTNDSLTVTLFPIPAFPLSSRVKQVLPEMLLTFMMILLLLTIADRTLRKGIKTFKKESAQNEVTKRSRASKCRTTTNASDRYQS